MRSYLTPLAECKELEKLSIPEQIKKADSTSSPQVDFLRKLPNLKFLDYAADGEPPGHKMLTVDEFFARYGGDAKK